MLASLIQWSINNRVLVLLLSLVITLIGVRAVQQTAVDAIPDLSDVQVIVKTAWPGQSPRTIEDQVTYPLTSALLGVPGARTVRGFSFFGDSYIYVLFDDDTDLYWARSRVLESLNQISNSLPEGARVQLGPDATGVGWVYIYALDDPSGRTDLSELRSLQDYFLRYELQTVPGVSEVATVGGFVRQYQVRVDPLKLKAYNLSLSRVIEAVQSGQGETGASVLEQGEAESMIRLSGYYTGAEALRDVVLGSTEAGVPILLSDIARIQVGPAMRRGVAELDGRGETVGGIVVMRWGENASEVIRRVKERLEQLSRGLPDSVEIVPVYDRSDLIQRAVDNLWSKLILEFVVVGLVCLIFLWHARSTLVAVLSLPIGILAAFIVMQWQGLNANIMSLGGIAIAIGAMIDAAIVMIENLHKHIERQGLSDRNRWELVALASKEVGPALFFSLLIITVSFLPVFALEAQEGRLFAPLAYTKTYAMAAAAILAVTLVPVLMGYCIRGRVLPESRNPVNRGLIALYRPVLKGILARPFLSLLVTLLTLVLGWLPVSKIGSEFMPPLDEGDLMYMPTTYPGVSIGKAREILQQTDAIIRTVPEVERVFGKVGRAETATDPAPLTMIETFIKLKPRDQWRPGLSSEDLQREFDRLVKFPGLSNAWVMPIKTRIDMLATGIKTPVGVKVTGPDLGELQRIGQELEALFPEIAGTVSAYAERTEGGRYLQIDPDRQALARFGISLKEWQSASAAAIGGMNVSETVEGLERYSVNIRYPEDYRNTPEAIEQLPLVTSQGQWVTLGEVSRVTLQPGPPMIKSENARPTSWVYVDIEGRSLGDYVAEAQQVVAERIALPPGYALNWAGQFEYLQRVEARMQWLIPLTLGLIAILLFLNFRRFGETLLVMLSIPFALIGGIWLVWLMDFHFSVAVAVGFIALAGVAAETGVIMLVYLEQAWKSAIQEARQQERALTQADLDAAIMHGAVERVRPKMMTVAAIMAGLLPILLGTGTGSEVMQRIAAPMVGGMISSTVLTLAILPLLYRMMKSGSLKTEKTR